MQETSRTKVFVHFDNAITNFDLAYKVITNIFKKEEIEFYNSVYFYNNKLSFEERKNDDLPSGIYLEKLKFAILEITHPEQLEKLKARTEIADITPNVKVNLKCLEPNFDLPLDNWGIKRLNVENSKYQGLGVKVAILDTGIDLEHFGFDIPDYRTSNFVYPNEDVQDKCGHGTHVAGIVGGGNINGLQVGVAPKIKLYVGKVLNDSGNFYDKTSVTLGIEWALFMGCKVINLSLGYPVRKNDEVDKEFQIAITQAYKEKAIIVAAVGNDSSRNPKGKSHYEPIRSPSNCKHAIAVSAIDSGNNIYCLANRSINGNQEIDFIAPGVNILSAFPISMNSKGYAFLDGTSMATPFIAGLLALYSEGNLNKDPEEIIKLLKENINPIKANTLDTGDGMPVFKSNLILTLKNEIKMSHSLDYQGSLILQNDLGLQEVYSSQNYGTFYSIYLNFSCSTDKNDKNVINMTDIEFSIVNYKGILNLGIVDITIVRSPDRQHLDFRVDVRAMERNRDFPLIDKQGNPMIVEINKAKIKDLKVTRTLLPMNEFNPKLNPNHPNNTVFDSEFYYRDGLLFDETENQRKRWPGMKGSGSNASGKRCYQITLKII